MNCTPLVISCRQNDSKLKILDFRFWILDWEVFDPFLLIEKAATVGIAVAYSIEMTVLNQTNPKSKI